MSSWLFLYQGSVLVTTCCSQKIKNCTLGVVWTVDCITKQSLVWTGLGHDSQAVCIHSEEKVGLASIAKIMQEKIVCNILYNLVYYLFIKLLWCRLILN